ncbi:hypothetical protein NDU88_004217 [Pleurodeles waltl]|uniref:Uncharacterized protein n=1 Tax=Pleurodeles waltl TaxID=8319 RepID=A0AAV7W4A7_PLEWA|nr:hypothetical protein NDU88_004217 [Pleurodeles waltl]
MHFQAGDFSELSGALDRGGSVCLSAQGRWELTVPGAIYGLIYSPPGPASVHRLPSVRFLSRFLHRGGGTRPSSRPRPLHLQGPEPQRQVPHRPDWASDPSSRSDQSQPYTTWNPGFWIAPRCCPPLLGSQSAPSFRRGLARALSGRRPEGKPEPGHQATGPPLAAAEMGGGVPPPAAPPHLLQVLRSRPCLSGTPPGLSVGSRPRARFQALPLTRGDRGGKGPPPRPQSGPTSRPRGRRGLPDRTRVSARQTVPLTWCLPPR